MFTISALFRFNSATLSKMLRIQFLIRCFITRGHFCNYRKKTSIKLLKSGYFYSLLQKYNNFIKNNFLLKFFLISISEAKDGGFQGTLAFPCYHTLAVF